MIRVVVFLIVVGLLALGFAWLADRPGDVVLTWQGRQFEHRLWPRLARPLRLSDTALPPHFGHLQ